MTQQHIDNRRIAPAVARNRGPILDLLKPELPETGLILEVASGTGEHVAHFARALPRLDWQPSDPSADARASIDAWVRAERLANVRPAIALDATAPDWPIGDVAAMLCVNMLHISEWAATEGLMRGAGARLGPGGLLFVYGPFRRRDAPTAPSNAAFDADLRSRDARWGLRDVETVAACASAQGLLLDRLVEMPANNLSLLFRKAQPSI